jgi:hypothetical protein
MTHHIVERLFKGVSRFHDILDADRLAGREYISIRLVRRGRDAVRVYKIR